LPYLVMIVAGVRLLPAGSATEMAEAEASQAFHAGLVLGEIPAQRNLSKTSFWGRQLGYKVPFLSPRASFDAINYVVSSRSMTSFFAKEVFERWKRQLYSAELRAGYKRASASSLSHVSNQPTNPWTLPSAA